MAQNRRTARHAAARERAHARFQLGEIEWLGELVVGARVEAAHAWAARAQSASTPFFTQSTAYPD